MDTENTVYPNSWTLCVPVKLTHKINYHIQQEDDKPEAVAARLRQYKDVAKPIIELYK